MTSPAARQFPLAALLAAATLLFAVGVIAERSAADEHAAPAASAESGEGEEGGHTDEQGVGEAARGAGSSAESDKQERLLGVDLESTPLIVLAVLAGLALSAAAASDLRHRRAFLVAVAVIALAWAVLDVRELLHQFDESRTGIAVVALAVALLHLAAAAVAGRGASSDSTAGVPRVQSVA
jgi:hypothetical protein